MKKLSKYIDKIGMVLLSSIIIIFSLIIGANEKGLRVLPISILLLLIIIFLVCKKLIKKEESVFFKNKIDIFVFVFILSTFLPLIFKTYSSFSYTIEFILKYVFYYSVYVLSRNVIDKKDKINSIYTVIIFTSIIPIILGLDARNEKPILKPILEYFNLLYNYNYKPGFTFGYSNTMAIYMSVCIFLSLFKISNTKEKIEKYIYIVYILFGLYIVYVSYSRMVILLLGIFLLIYFIKTYKKQIKENKKKIITITSIILIIGTFFLSFALTVSKPLYTNGNVYDKILNYKFKKNKKYKITIDLDLLYYNKQHPELNENAFNIKLVGLNKYYKEQLISNKYMEVGHQKYEYEFTMPKNVESIKLYVYNNNKGSMQINNIYINDEEYIIKYKYLPEKVGKALNGLRLNDKSLVERYYFNKSSINIFKRHIIFGNDGNDWKTLSKTKQEYAFSMKETHSYFFELLISFGLVGIITYSIMLSSILLVLKDNKKKKEQNILLYALGMLLLHSIIFDFNMSFMFIQIITYVLFSCILVNEKKDKKINAKYDYVVFSILVLSLITSSYITFNLSNKNALPLDIRIVNKRIESIKNNKYTSKQKIKVLKDIMKKEPYYNQNYIYNLYFKELSKSKLNTKELDKNYDFILKQMKSIDQYSPYYIDSIYIREKVIYNAIKSLEESNHKNKDKYINKLKKLLIKEHDRNIEYIKDVEKNDKPDYIINKALPEYNKLYNEVK